MKFNAGATVAILSVMTLLCAGYLSFAVLGMDPATDPTRITLMLDTSGGLMPTSQVTMRGIQVGRVTGIRTTPTGLLVSIDIDRSHPVPADSQITVQNLSLAGEQYVDFKPKVIAAPYFSDGSVIPADRVAAAPTVSDLLAKANAILAVLNPECIGTIVTNVGQAFAGNDGAVDSLAATAGLAAKLERENSQLLATLLGNASTLMSNMDRVQIGAALTGSGKLLPNAVLALTGLVREVDKYSHAADGAFAPGAPVPTLVANLERYVDTLSGPLSTFAAALQPATAPLRGVRIDAGRYLDLWDSAFDDAGGIRVRVTAPEGAP